MGLVIETICDACGEYVGVRASDWCMECGVTLCLSCWPAHPHPHKPRLDPATVERCRRCEEPGDALVMCVWCREAFCRRCAVSLQFDDSMWGCANCLAACRHDYSPERSVATFLADSVATGEVKAL